MGRRNINKSITGRIVNRPLSIVHYVLLFSFFTFHFSFLKAQDTLAPKINMSQSAYDSIIRALKKSQSPKKDTVKAVDTASPKVILIQKRGDMYDGDSARQAIERHRMDSAVKAASQDSIKHKADSGRKLKVKRTSDLHAGMDAYDSARIQSKRHRRDSLMRADSISKASRHDTLSHVHKNKWQPDGFIAFNFGIGLPLDAFVSAGSAATGENFSLCATFPGLISRFNWVFKFDYGLNGINNPQFLHNVAEGYPDYTFTTVATSQAYSFYTLMMGPGFSFPYGKLTFDVRVLFGILTGTIPQSAFNVTDSAGGSLNVVRAQATATAFAFSFGLDARYKVLPYLSVILNYDYLTSTPSFNYVSGGFQATPNGVAGVATQSTILTQGFQLNSLTIGVAFNIAAKRK